MVSTIYPSNQDYIICTPGISYKFISGYKVGTEPESSRVPDGWLSFHMKRKEFKEQHESEGLSSNNIVIRIAAIIFSILSFGFDCYTKIDQYHNSKEDGIFAFTVLMVLTPILNLVMLLFNIPGNG